MAGDVCKATPFFLFPPLFLFFLFLSPTLTPFVSSHSFSLNLASFPLCEDQVISIHSVCRYLGLKFWVFARDFLRGYTLCSLSSVLFCSWGDSRALEALHWVPCFYKFSHLIEHLAECFHVEEIDGVQYSRTWSWVKINTLDTSLGVNSPFRTSPTAPLIVLTTEHFLWCIYNQAIWDQERAYNLSRVRYRGIHPNTCPLGMRYKLYCH